MQRAVQCTSMKCAVRSMKRAVCRIELSGEWRMLQDVFVAILCKTTSRGTIAHRALSCMLCTAGCISVFVYVYLCLILDGIVAVDRPERMLVREKRQQTTYADLWTRSQTQGPVTGYRVPSPPFCKLALHMQRTAPTLRGQSFSSKSFSTHPFYLATCSFYFATDYSTATRSESFSTNPFPGSRSDGLIIL